MSKKITSFFVYFLCFAMFLGNFSLSFLEAEFVQAKDGNYKQEILVKFRNQSNLVLIKVPENKDFKEFLKMYNKKENVEYAEKNSVYKISIIPTDTYYNKQWYLKKIKAPEAWDRIRKTPKTVIAIIDSGVQLRHPDLRPNIWENTDEIPDNKIDDDKNGFIDDFNGWDFVNNVPDPSPKFEEGFTEAGIMHGTIVAGIAAAVGNNGSGVTGIAWDAKIMPLKVLDDKGEGKVSEVIRAIDYAINNKADIINFSFVGLDYSQALFEAVRRAHRAGIIMVAAAGNEQEQGEGYNLDETPMYPACYDGDSGENMVIGVVATDVIDQKAPFSSYGFKCVDIAAPGISFFSTVVYKPTEKIGGKALDQYFGGFWSGTSMATPVIAGTVALIEEINPGLNTKQVKEILLESTDNIGRLNPDYLGRLGRGRVNVFSAVSLAEDELKEKDLKILIAPYSNSPSKIKKYETSGELINEFLAFEENFLGGSSVVSGDIDGNGKEEIIVGASFGGGPHVRMFNSFGKIIGQFFAYDENFRGGVNVATGDIDGDGKDEIITGAGNTGGPHVRIFDNRGNLISHFFAYDKNFRGGVNVSVGDVDGDGEDEIITGAGVGHLPEVKIFKKDGTLIKSFLAYNSSFRGGVKVEVADIDGGTARKKSEIIVSPGVGGGPHVRIFSSNGKLISQFFAYKENFRGGVNLTAGDIDKDGLAEIITAAGPGGSPHVRMFEADGSLLDTFYAFNEDFNGGINIGTIIVKN